MKNVLNIRLQGKTLIGLMEEQAARLRCDPRQLAVAVMTITFRDEMIDNILDGDDPKSFAPHYAQAKPRGIRGVRQLRFYEWLKAKLDGAETCAFSYKTASAELGWSEPEVGNVARTLIARGEIVMTRSGRRDHPSTWSLARINDLEDAA